MPIVTISLGGSDVTDRVLFATATFTQRVNGKPGTAYMRLRDDAETLTVVTGADWLVTVDGDAAWRGFATQVSRVYAFEAENVDERIGRFIDVRGGDLNLLLTKRRVFNQATPTIGGKQFAAGTPDTTALTELFTNWLDLSSDSLNTDFTHVGDLDPEEKAWIGWAGWTLADAMANIAMLPGAIFYIRPNAGTPRGTIVYCDADTPTAPFGLSDVPDGTTTKGYREMEILLDGSSLANDVMGWGMGYGSQRPVFRRMQDVTSIASHGRWQTSQVTPGVYKQGTINRIVDSIINGSPENLRGAKDDMPSVTLVTWEPGLVAGDVVAFESQVWGWSDAIPIREMTITFPSPTDPRYEMLLSHEVDAPWSSLDLWWPKIPWFPGIEMPQLPGNLTDDPECDCGVESYDDFERVEASGWGTATPGGDTWSISGLGTTSVDGTSGLMAVADDASANISIGAAISGSSVLTAGAMTVTSRFRLDTVPIANNFRFSVESDSGVNGTVSIVPRNDAFGGVYISTSGGGGSSFAAMTFAVDTWYLVEWLWPDDGSGTSEVRVWLDGASRPDTPTVTRSSFSINTPSPFFSVAINAPNAHSPAGWEIAYIDLGANLCSDEIDNFDRTVADGWGVAIPSGLTWVKNFPTISGVWSVAPGVASVEWPLFGGGHYTIYAADVPWAGQAMDLTVKFRFAHMPEGDSSDTSSVYISVRGSTSSSVDYATVQVSPLAGPPSTGQAKSLIRCVNSTEDTYIDPSYWTAGIWYFLRFRVDEYGEFSAAKVWKESEVEPDWMVTGTGYPVSSTLVMAPAWNRSSAEFSITNQVDFAFVSTEYDSAPCYYDCGPDGLADDFGRTLSGSWGLSSAGYEWSVGGTFWAAGVGSGYGYLSGTTLDDPTLSRATLGLTLPVGAVLKWGWSVQSAGAPVATAFDGVLPLEPEDTAGDWYWTQVEITSAGIDWKQWKDGDTEPPAYTGSISTPPPTVFDVAISNNTGLDAALWVDDLSIWFDCHAVEPVDGALPTYPSGYGCVEATRETSTTYSVPSPFTPTSTLVWRSGLLQLRGTDYTEDSDHMGVTFSDSIGASESVRICYFTEVLTP